MTPASAWRLCALAGLATLAASTAFGRIPGLAPCGPSDGAGAILALELARAPETVAALFGSEPCTARLLAAQRSALWLDMLGFIPAYAAFLALAGWALRGAGRRLALAAAAAVLIAGLCDEVEGVTMFAVMDPLPGTAWLFAPLFWAVRVKFALLGVGEVLLAMLLFRTARLGPIAAVPIAAGGLVSIWFLFAAPHEPLMMKAHSYAWAALLVVAVIGAIRPALVSREIQV
ncbi:MAG: hypothetical protein V4574_09900 [Pseudomonadota bacterium]